MIDHIHQKRIYAPEIIANFFVYIGDFTSEIPCLRLFMVKSLLHICDLYIILYHNKMFFTANRWTMDILQYDIWVTRSSLRQLKSGHIDIFYSVFQEILTLR